MKKNNIRIAGLGLSLCLAVLATEVAHAQQGKGNAKKDATEVSEDPEAKDKNQRGNASKQNEKAAQKNNQGQGKENKDRDKTNNSQAGQNADKANKGNAYGQNKGEASGREFGQSRAADARLTGEQKRAELGTTVEEGDKKVKEAKEKISRAKNELERDRKARKITDAEYNEKKATIERAERAVQVLEEKVKTGRGMVTVSE